MKNLRTIKDVEKEFDEKIGGGLSSNPEYRNQVKDFIFQNFISKSEISNTIEEFVKEKCLTCRGENDFNHSFSCDILSELKIKLKLWKYYNK